MAQMREQDFRKAIEKGTLSGTYLLYGEESFSMLQTVQKLMKKVESNGFGDFNLQRFDGSSCQPDEISAALEALPFFAEQKVVLLRDLSADSLSASDLEQYQSIIRDLPQTSVFVIYLSTIVLGKRMTAKWKSFFGTDSQKLTTVEFARKTDSELEKYLMTYAEKHGCTLPKELAKRILFLCGKDLQTLRNEIGKVCGFVGEGAITREQVDRVITVHTEAQIFALSSAIIGGEAQRAYHLIDQLLSQGEEPVSIVALLSSSYLNLYRAKSMIESRKSVMELSSYFDYKGKEFLLRTAEQDSSRFSKSSLRKSLDLLLEADLALKGGSGSSRDEMKRVVLDTLIAKLLLAAQEA